MKLLEPQSPAIRVQTSRDQGLTGCRVPLQQCHRYALRCIAAATLWSAARERNFTSQHGEASPDVCCSGSCGASTSDSSKCDASLTHQRGCDEVESFFVAQCTPISSLRSYKRIFRSLDCRNPPTDYSRVRGKAPKNIDFEEDRLYKSLVARTPGVSTAFSASTLSQLISYLSEPVFQERCWSVSGPFQACRL